VVQNAGRIYTIATDGEVVPLGTGDVISTNGRWLMSRRCDDAMVCTLALGDLDRSDRHLLPFGFTSIANGQFGVLISPDGTTFVGGDADGTSSLFDLGGRRIAQIDARARPAWTPDGDWLFTRGTDHTLVAISTRGAKSIEITLPGDELDSQDLLLAVG
jgi:WD40 repeat protein